MRSGLCSYPRTIKWVHCTKRGKRWSTRIAGGKKSLNWLEMRTKTERHKGYQVWWELWLECPLFSGEFFWRSGIGRPRSLTLADPQILLWTIKYEALIGRDKPGYIRPNAPKSRQVQIDVVAELGGSFKKINKFYMFLTRSCSNALFSACIRAESLERRAQVPVVQYRFHWNFSYNSNLSTSLAQKGKVLV